MVDGSIEPAGDVLSPIKKALADPDVGICGPFGIVTDDLREFRDAIERYKSTDDAEILRRIISERISSWLRNTAV